MSKKIVTRFAPSPTGEPHIGSLRVALYNWIFARQQGGEFILRIEDTDRERYVEGAEKSILEMMAWSGLSFDRQPTVQSTRREVHIKYAEQLIESGHAYKCFCTPERLAKMREEQQAKKERPRYDGTCRDLSEEEALKRIQNDEKYVVRFKIPESGETKIQDKIRGEIVFVNSELDDFVILKSDGYPTYHLAHMVDDHESGVTHVIRGEEWLPSLPKHWLLHEAFGWEVPVYAHLPLILATDKSKLSKRHGSVSVVDFKTQGYLPEALVNFVLLLGWHPKKGSEKEIFSKEEMLKEFKLEDVQKSGAIFDYEKLDWMNKEYMKKTPIEKIIEFGTDLGIDIFSVSGVESTIRIESERAKNFKQLAEAIKPYYEDIEYDTSLLVWKKSDALTAKSRLEGLLELFEKVEDKKWKEEELEQVIKRKIEQEGWQNGDTLWPLRVALLGQKNSAGPFEIAGDLGKEKSLKRINIAVEKLSNL